MKGCPHCSITAPDVTRFCSRCGRPTVTVVGFPSENLPTSERQHDPPSRTGHIFVAVGLALLVVLFIVGIRNALTAPPVHHPEFVYVPPGRAISYRITCWGDADVTYINESGGVEQRSVASPWIMDFRATTGRRVYISAQSSDAGYLTLELRLDNERVQTAETSQRFWRGVSGRDCPVSRTFDCRNERNFN